MSMLSIGNWRQKRRPGANEAGPPFPRVEVVYESDLDLAGKGLATAVVQRILAEFNHIPEEASPTRRRLLGPGAPLNLAEDGDTIWGGRISLDAPTSMLRCRRLDVRAVCGPISGDLLARCGIVAPAVFGHPILLLPRLFPGRFRAKDLRPYVVVPALTDLHLFPNEASLVSPSTPWNTYVERILEASFVVAGSIEGLAVAEAFGIPARFVSLSGEAMPEAFEDYALGTARNGMEVACSIEAALDMGGMPEPVVDREALIASFPIDLWRDGVGAVDERHAS